MGSKKLSLTEDVDKPLKPLEIHMYVSPENGETYFALSQKGVRKKILRKCLYDALSDYGIRYEMAKEIVADIVPQVNKKFSYKLLVANVGPKYDLE